MDKLDELLKSYVRKLMENSASMLEQLNRDLARENDEIAETEQSADHLAEVLDELMEEMKVTKRQRIREIMKKPEKEAEIEATYDELEEELQKKIDGLNHQIDLLSDRRNTVIQVNRAAKTALDVFADILNKETLDRNDLELIIDRVLVFEDHLEIKLQRDIDSLLRCGTLEDAANFNEGIENNLKTVIQSARNRADKVFDVNVINDGDPLEIFTDREGGILLRKYSPMGELNHLGEECCDSLFRATGLPPPLPIEMALSPPPDPKKLLLEQPLTRELMHIMEERRFFVPAPGGLLPRL